MQPANDLPFSELNSELLARPRACGTLSGCFDVLHPLAGFYGVPARRALRVYLRYSCN